MGLLGAFKNFAIVTELIYGSAFTAPTLFNSPKEAEVAPLYNAPSPVQCTDDSQIPREAQRKGKPSCQGGLLRSLPGRGSWVKHGQETTGDITESPTLGQLSHGNDRRAAFPCY